MAAVTYVVNVYNSTKRHTGGLWRDGHGEGGIDMSPVSVLLAVGVVVMCFSVVMVVGSWVPKVCLLSLDCLRGWVTDTCGG